MLFVLGESTLDHKMYPMIVAVVTIVIADRSYAYPETRYNYGKKDESSLINPYRFRDEVFTDVSRDVPVEYMKEGEDCERVLHESMICMVCKDPKNKAKYEQCSYAAPPVEKTYSYSKSKSLSKSPKEKETEPYDEVAKKDESEQRKSTISTNCKKFEEKGKICTICKDPIIGGNYERCSYAYQPKDKVYKFSRSKSFGFPTDKSDDEETEKREEESVEERAEAAKVRPTYDHSDYFYDPSEGSGDKTTYESALASEKIDKSKCKSVRKGSMTCTTCGDPKTGRNFERCEYTYEPKDKDFSYKKGSSFGSSTPSDVAKEDAREEDFEPSGTSTAVDKSGDKEGKTSFYDVSKKKAEIERFLEEFRKENRSDCKKVKNDDMICYVCTDDEGFRKEECMSFNEQEPVKDRLTYRDVKEFKFDPTKASPSIVDPIASASEIVKQTQNVENTKEKTQRGEHLGEAEPYEYVAETRPVYDKDLGFTLPAYMLATSEHEVKFDEMISSSKT